MASFSLEMKVRDYECDMQGIVNNAIYQHYLECARHEFLLSRGLDFAELTASGVIIVIVRAELDYCSPLRSGEHFRVTVRAQRSSRIKILFEQEILRLPEPDAVLKAKITATSLHHGKRPYFPEQLHKLLD